MTHDEIHKLCLKFATGYLTYGEISNLIGAIALDQAKYEAQVFMTKELYGGSLDLTSDKKIKRREE